MVFQVSYIVPGQPFKGIKLRGRLAGIAFFGIVLERHSFQDGANPFV